MRTLRRNKTAVPDHACWKPQSHEHLRPGEKFKFKCKGPRTRKAKGEGTGTRPYRAMKSVVFFSLSYVVCHTLAATQTQQFYFDLNKAHLIVKTLHGQKNSTQSSYKAIYAPVILYDYMLNFYGFKLSKYRL